MINRFFFLQVYLQKGTSFFDKLIILKIPLSFQFDKYIILHSFKIQLIDFAGNNEKKRID